MSKEILEAALDYARRGWAVFPISKDKSPLTQHGFKDATTDEAQIKKWFTHYTGANVAIATGEASGGLVVVDIDIDEDAGKHGDETFDEWLEDNGAYIDTLTAVTGRGGKHLYFRSSKPYGCLVGAMPSIDIRGWGGYVIAPPSVHKNGRTYEWDCLADDIEEEIVNVQEDSDVQYFLDQCFHGHQSETKEPFKLPEVVQKGSRNDTIFKMASSMQSKGMDDDDIIRLCRGANNDFQPPLDDDELLRTIQQALKFEKGNAKKQTPPQEEKKNEPKEFRKLKRAAELMEKTLPEPVVFVGVGEEVPFLVEGTCILSAKPKLGKSWLVLAMCLAISRGEPFLGYKTRKCSTLYLDLETSEQLQQKRIKKALNGDPVPSNFYLDTETYGLDDGFVDQIRNYLEQDPQIGVVVIDVFQIIRSAAKSFKETEYDHVYRDITPLNNLAQEKHIAIILVCHDRKVVDPEDPFSNILGSTGLQGAATQMVVMFKKTKKLPIHISVKGKTIDGLPELDVELKNGQWSTVDISKFGRTDEDKEREEEYLNSDIRKAMLAIMDKTTRWRGRATLFINDAFERGVALEATPKQVGGFLSNYQGFFKKRDNIIVRKIDNGTGPKIYEVTTENQETTIDTIDEGEFSPLMNDENPYK